MEVSSINRLLLEASPAALAEALPHLKALRESKHQFRFDFGLESLPDQPGILLVRGPRQYGKSTWLEQQMEQSHKKFGPGSVLYINADYLRDADELFEEIRGLAKFFSSRSAILRLFIDEITSVAGWEVALKKLADRGELRSILVVTTGSKAQDLRRGIEKLPGRKGRLPRSTFIFTPISFAEYKRVCGRELGDDLLNAYLLSGGSPIACAAVAEHKALPEFIVELVMDWIFGAIAQSGRSRGSALGVIEAVNKFAQNPVGQAKLARETGLASNTLAQGYIDVFGDLLCILPSFPKDLEKGIVLRRRPCKFHYVNLLAAICLNPSMPRTLKAFSGFPEAEKGKLLEWLIAQELWRRRCITQSLPLDELYFCGSREHEIDFVEGDRLIEVKNGKSHPADFEWFTKSFPNRRLCIVGGSRYETKGMEGKTVEDFLLEG